LAEHVQDQAEFLDTKLKPKLDAAVAGQGHVFFVDAAHFVFGTILCCLWSFTRIFVRAASGRQRFNVLGAWNAVTRELIAVTNTTVVNTETMCALLRKIADLGLTGSITLVAHWGTLGPPIISSGYWTDESALGTFDHHEAGRVDVRPGQGIASRCGASEHGTAESRGGRGRG
jgi:hypothetical protein